MKIVARLTLAVLLGACTTSREESEENQPTRVLIETTMGNITLELSDKTPKHRDNFIKLVNDGIYDSIIFHRVLQDFVVQAGEFDSLRLSNMDSTVVENLDYRIPAEFDSTLFHKRGALGAARDGNPERASSNIQFYIVQRGARPDTLILKDEERINGWLREHYTLQAPENKIWLDSLNAILASDNYETYGSLLDTISKIADGFEDFQPYRIPAYQREIYRTTGGTPHLDQNYTVFGEVIDGMDVVDSIATEKVADGGRPIDQVLIVRARIIK